MTFSKPLLFGIIKEYRLTIYNRWGAIVFQTNQSGKGWDGKIAGLTQSNNTFVWTCTYRFEGQDLKTERGTVTLIR
ncbi:MAG TPA: gliding motility-associated C-terminal domain-containing protein [Flavisolibacter sp.]|nr:gliding motility-associated C-terminal domain-containing protein [Flavisolibacter sp.]